MVFRLQTGKGDPYAGRMTLPPPETKALRSLDCISTQLDRFPSAASLVICRQAFQHRHAANSPAG